MTNQLTAAGSDALLLPFLQAHDHSLAESLLTDLIQNHADPIITKILSSKLRVSLNGSHGNQQNQDALEIAAELRVVLIGDLQAAQQRPFEKSIKSFPDYVAIKTYSACADYFREKNPRRWRLKNLLRYQLKQNSRFVLWKAENNTWQAGLSEWAGADTQPTRTSDLNPESFSRNGVEKEPKEWLAAVFEHLGHAVEFERLVTLTAEVWQSRFAILLARQSRKISRLRGVFTIFWQALSSRRATVLASPRLRMYLAASRTRAPASLRLVLLSTFPWIEATPASQWRLAVVSISVRPTR